MKRANILVIHTDQQATWSVGAHGATEIQTPHLDRIAHEGAALHHCHTVSAVCTPSRGCLMTGQYPHQHGAYLNNIPLNNDAQTWAMQFRDAGYRTAYVGKWHLDGSLRPGFIHPQRGFGFDDTAHMFNRGHWKKMFDRPQIGEPGISTDVAEAPEEFTTDYLTDKCLDIIKRDDDRPFCVMLSIPDPHSPFEVREPYASMYNPDDMLLPESLHDEQRPSWIKLNDYNCGFRDQQNLKRLQREKAKYLGMVSCIDDNVGRLLKCLEEQEELDNTLILFTADHGEYLGEHGLMGKNSMYRSAYNVPCLIRYPEKIKAGTQLEQYCTQNDLVNTLCELGDVSVPAQSAGRSMVDLLHGTTQAWTDEVFQHHPSFNAAGLITRDWHLFLHKTGEHRLFNTKNDPDELHDVFNSEPEMVEQMYKRILEHHHSINSPAYRWLSTILSKLTIVLES